MKTTLLTSLLTLLIYTSYGQTIYTQQDFSGGGLISDYINSGNPGLSKFTNISASSGIGGPMSASIINGAVEFQRPGNQTGQGRITRSVDFDGSLGPKSLYIQYTIDGAKLPLSANGIFTSAAICYIGDNSVTGNEFNDKGGSPDLKETFAKLAIPIKYDLATDVFSWAVRDIASDKYSAYFVGKHLVTWVLNRAGGTLTYLKPNGVGGNSTLGANRTDVWVDGTQVLDEISAITSTIQLQRFKLIFDSGVGILRFDDFLIRDVSGALPVTLTRFSGKAQGAHVDLTWQTVSERNSDRFSIERSTDAQEFTEIGSVAAAGNADGQRTYGYTDLHPLPGLTYYRLRQLDQDGTASLSKIVAVDRAVTVPDFTVLDNPGAGTFITVRPENLPGAAYQLATLTGQLLTCQQRETPESGVTLLPQHTLPSGVYLLTASTGAIRLTRRVLVR